MSDALPFGVTIAPAPAELRLGGDDERERFDWRRPESSRVSPVQSAKAFPEPVAVEPLDGKQFACSGGVGSTRYREATIYRRSSEMTWEEARVALRRLYLPVQYVMSSKPAEFIALAELALVADGREGFVGKKGEHAGKLRDELGLARGYLRDYLGRRLDTAEHYASRLARPILRQIEDMSVSAIADRLVGAFSTALPVAGGRWVQLSEALPDEVTAALEALRARWTEWVARRSVVEDVIARVQSAERPSPAEYAEAVHIAEMLCFVGEKLTSLYQGIMFSMPVYRLYPATSESEAITLWWPWGRPAPLMAGEPPRPPKPRKQVVDPGLITATQPQHVVREVMAKTGINRTTAQQMTVALRRKMRSQRRTQAERLLGQGLSKAEVARRVGLSPSRISAMFKGEPRVVRQKKAQRLFDAYMAASRGVDDED